MRSVVPDHPPCSLGSRAAQLERLRTERFDLLVVGGGITGAGIAWDAASRGLSVALIEKDDYAGGTSSRSSKLIHGGLRYLAQGQIALTREALLERGRLQHLAPHLVELLPFAFPIYNGLLERAKLTAGLWLYDLFALGSGAPGHSWRDRAATRRLAPGLRTDDVAGSFIYRDARTDDARLVIEVLRAAAGYGAALANYVAMEDLLTAGGRALGVTAVDRETGEAFQIRSRCVVLATGVWLDQVLPPARHGVRRVHPAKGVHLVLPGNRFPADTALYLSTTGDGRYVFVIPWQGRTLIGTTDTPYDGDLDAPRASTADVCYLLETVNRAFPDAPLRETDVLNTQAGLRPLAAGDEGTAGTTAAMSREDRIFETESGVIAIAGGKLTTFRHMAAKVVDLVARRLGGARGVGPARTATLPLAGFDRPLDPAAYAVWKDAALRDAPPGRERLIARYGAHYPAVEALIAADPKLAEPLLPGLPGLPALRAEALFAIRYEQARSVADVLSQRLRLSLLAPDQGREAARTVARLLAGELGWDASRTRQEEIAYHRYAEQFSVPGVSRAPAAEHGLASALPSGVAIS